MSNKNIDNHIKIAGANLYRVTFTLGKGETEKLVVANNTNEVIEMMRHWIINNICVVLVEPDISMIVMDTSFIKAT